MLETPTPQITAGILGASGYTGLELVRLLHHHPHVTVHSLAADSNAGKTLGELYPAMLPHPEIAELRLCSVDAIDAGALDVLFAALPHGASAAILADLMDAHPSLRIIDFSADFRLTDPDQYAAWYGIDHPATDKLAEAVYGLAEFAGGLLPNARLIANPGCFPTGATLPVIPLLRAGLIDPTQIIIDAKTGVSGAGRAGKPQFLLADLHEDFYPYGIDNLHRHRPEIEQVLKQIDPRVEGVYFAPHLLPIPRGILSTIHLRLADSATLSEVHACLIEAYADSACVQVLPLGKTPTLAAVRGTNCCAIGIGGDQTKYPNKSVASSRIAIYSAIDNLVKGASGQAVQNMNLMFGLPESTALQLLPVFP